MKELETASIKHNWARQWLFARNWTPQSWAVRQIRTEVARGEKFPKKVVAFAEAAGRDWVAGLIDSETIIVWGEKNT